jgi:hypothetical protein
MRIPSIAACAAAVCVAAFLPTGAFAATIFDQSIDLTVNAIASDFDFAFQSADDFQLQPGANTISDVHWWGVYALANTPTQPDNFTIHTSGNAL